MFATAVADSIWQATSVQEAGAGRQDKFVTFTNEVAAGTADIDAALLDKDRDG